METPKVTVICLCYNQAAYVEASLQSVFQQTYSNIQIIVVDDASEDNSRQVIEKVIEDAPWVTFLPLEQNVGNCSAFNMGLRMAEGEYIIDLACDDLLMSERIAHQVACFQGLGPKYGVVYSDADYIDHLDRPLENHMGHLRRHTRSGEMPEGDIFERVLSQYFIASPTMMIRKSVFDFLGGYDEQLAYEDFDFWVRSSRHFHYAYIDKVLTKIRRLSDSMSSGWYKKGDRQLRSTYLICRKAQNMLRSHDEKMALVARVQFEVRQAVFSENYEEAELFLGMLRELGENSTFYRMLSRVNALRMPLAGFRKVYHRFRYGIR